MILLSCSNLVRGFNEGPLFEDVGFELHAGERVGLVGPNGAGKTTLLRLLAGEDQPDSGSVRLHGGARIALLQQEPQLGAGRTVFEEARQSLNELLAAHEEMVRAAEALAQAADVSEQRKLTARYDRLNELLRHHDAYNVDHRIDQILQGVGFRASEFQQPVDVLSGGQQRRLMLAKLLLAAPDVMLLDEPSNHLDIHGMRWLEDYLTGQPQGMIVVSHDRYFLDRIVTRILELHGRRLSAYPGNYQGYVKLRHERYQQQLKAWEAQQAYIARQEDYIRRVHYGQLHKQAQSRQKALDRLERVERPTPIEGPQMHFGPVRRSGDIVLHVSQLAKSYDRPLFSDLSLTLERGRRLGIMGPNGCGKTTLLKVLMGQEEPDRGTVQRGQLMEFGYYDQQLQALPDDQPVMRAVWPEPDPEVNEQRMRDLLARFGLTGDQVYQRVGELSGGERSRAALARLVALGVNVLVLDEPTNHLDVWACESLESALGAFEGTVLVVSHDRYFLNQVVDLLIVFEGEGQTSIIHGNYDTYEHMRTVRAPAAPSRDGSRSQAAEPTPSATDGVSAAPTKRKRRFPYRKVDELEAEIGACEMRLREVEERLASPELYRDGGRVKEAMRTFDDTKAQLQQLYEHWEEAVELNGR